MQSQKITERNLNLYYKAAVEPLSSDNSSSSNVTIPALMSVGKKTFTVNPF